MNSGFQHVKYSKSWKMKNAEKKYAQDGEKGDEVESSPHHNWKRAAEKSLNPWGDFFEVLVAQPMWWWSLCVSLSTYEVKMVAEVHQHNRLKKPWKNISFSYLLRMMLSWISTMWKLRPCSNNGGWVATTIWLGELHKQSRFFWLWHLEFPSVFGHLEQHQICLDFPWKLAMVIADRTKKVDFKTWPIFRPTFHVWGWERYCRWLWKLSNTKLWWFFFYILPLLLEAGRVWW